MIDSEPSFLIGVDGGGSGCRVAIGTAGGGVIASAEGGRANASSDLQQAIRNITDTVSLAARKAGLAPEALQTASAHIGVAGVIGPKQSAPIAAALPFRLVTVTGDRPTAVTGALGDNDGFLLAIGTGSIVASSLSGVMNFVGGWGFQISDHASGAWLGRAALEQVLLCHDGVADHTPLTRALFASYGENANEVVAFSIAAKPGDFATHAAAIIAAAKAGDPWARQILGVGAGHLMRGLTRLGFHAGDRLCLTGGVGPHYADYLPPKVLAGQVASQGSALDGAFLLAGRQHAEDLRGGS